MIAWADTLIEAGIDVPISPQFTIRCPFHEDRVDSCAINTDKGVWICFAGCGQGSLFSFVSKLLGISLLEVKNLAIEESLTIDLNFDEIVEPVITELDEIQLSPDLILDKYAKWVYDRGFTKETLLDWSCATNRYHDLVIPVYDISSRLVGTVTRQLNRFPKYLYSKGFKKSQVLFGANRISKTKFVCVTEGTLDAMWLNQNGYSAVALLGMSLSKKQQEILASLPVEEVVLCLDSDEAGLKGRSITLETGGKEYPAGGDIIISVDDKEVRKISDILIHLQREKSVGDEMVLGVLRDGEFLHITLELVERPDL